MMKSTHGGNPEGASNINENLANATTGNRAVVETSRQMAADPCVLRGIEGSLDPRVQAFLDERFSRVDISTPGQISFTMKSGNSPNHTILDLTNLTTKIRGAHLSPTGGTESAIPDIHTSLKADFSATCVINVPGCENKSENDMRAALEARGMQYSDRLTSVLALNLSLLLSGENPLAGGMQFRDSAGVMYGSNDSWLISYGSDNLESDPGYAGPKLLALGSSK